MNLDTLWNYMQFDLEADKFGSDMRKSPKRQLLVKDRNFLKEQQMNIAKIESDVSAMNDRMEAIRGEVERLNKLLDEQRARLESEPPQTAEEIKERTTAIKKVLDSLERYEQELSKMRKDADTRDRQQKDIHVRAAKTKAEYDAVKLEYDREYADDTVKLKNLRARAEAEEKKTDPADLEKYKSIKAHVTPPMAKMMNNQCGGCFMALPLGTLRDLKSGEHMVTCDNCGRILYAKDE